MNELRLSVVMPNYNHAQFLGKAVKEVLSQSFSPYEIIIIDDGSTDDSVKVIERIINENPGTNIKLIRNDQNRGVIYTCNRGLREAFGQYIYFAAADDIVYDDFFEVSMRLLAKYPQAGLCSSVTDAIYMDGRSILMPLNNPSSNESYLSASECLRLLRKYDSWMGGNSCLYRRDAVLECGGLIPELSALSDIFLGMLVALKYGACFVPKQMVAVRVMPYSYSANFYSSVDGQMEFYSYAARLMKTTYADFFPSDYANAWEKRMEYRARLITANKMLFSHIMTMSDTIARKNPLDKFFFFCVKLGMVAQFFAALLYLFFRLDAEWRTALKRGASIKLSGLKGRFLTRRKAPLI